MGQSLGAEYSGPVPCIFISSKAGLGLPRMRGRGLITLFIICFGITFGWRSGSPYMIGAGFAPVCI